MGLLNRLGNARNPYQGGHLRVLCVCSAGLLRSPTLAWVLGQEPWGYNTRAVGVNDDYALIPMDQVHIKWADKIVFVEKEIRDYAERKFGDKLLPDEQLVVLNIPDNFEYRDPELVRIIREQVEELGV